MSSELELSAPETTAMATRGPVSADPMLALVERAARDPGVDVDKMERLLAMAERVNAKKAETEFDQAMNAAQTEMRPVCADSTNPQTRSRYASYTALDGAIRPIYTKHGFSLSFNTKPAAVADHVLITARVSHRAGHTERYEIEMPADGKGARGNDVMTKTHATGSATSYGMRYLLKMIFNVAWTTTDDDDGNAAGKGPKRPQDASTLASTRSPAPTAPTPARAQSGPATAKDAKALDAWLEKCRAKLVADLAIHGQAAVDYAVNAGLILPNEALADAKAAAWFPKVNRAAGVEGNIALVREARDMHLRAIQAQMDGEQVPSSAPAAAVGAVPEAKAFTQTANSPIDKLRAAADATPKVVPTTCPHCQGTATKPDPEFVDTQICQKCGWRWDEDGQYYEEHPWMETICPIPHPKGTPRVEYEKAPITMGQLCRIDNGRWYGFIMNTTVAEVRQGREYRGKHYAPSAADLEWAEACEQAKAHLEASKAEGADEEYPKGGKPIDPSDETVPF